MSDIISVDEAIARLAVVDYDPGGEGGIQPCVHTFRASSIMLGAHWTVEATRAAMEKFGVRENPPDNFLAGMNHGLVVIDDTGPVFFETKRGD